MLRLTQARKVLNDLEKTKYRLCDEDAWWYVNVYNPCPFNISFFLIHFTHCVDVLTDGAKILLCLNDVLFSTKESNAIRLLQCCRAAIETAPDSPWLEGSVENKVRHFPRSSPFRTWVMTPCLRRPTIKLLEFGVWRDHLKVQHAALAENLYLKEVSPDVNSLHGI